MKVIIDSAIPFLNGVLEPFADVVYKDGGAIVADDVVDADALIVRTRTRCDRALLEGSTVRFIATATIGFDHIDLNYCNQQGIVVSTAAGCNARGVLQWVAAVLVVLARRDGFVPSQRTLGVVGVGNVGRLIKEYAEAWGFNVICCDPPREEREHLGFLPLEQVLEHSDIVTIHTPLDDTTRAMINDKTISLLKRNSVIINASRGEVAKTEALLREDLTCAIDVWEHEPNIDKRLLEKAIVATPHIAGYSLQGKANASAMSVNALARYFGLPLEDWYPAGVNKCCPQVIDWQTINKTIDNYCDVVQQSVPLKRGGDFEALRNGYSYREEYF